MARCIAPLVAVIVALSSSTDAFTALYRHNGWIPFSANIHRSSALHAATLTAPRSTFNLTDVPSSILAPIPTEPETNLPDLDPSTIEFIPASDIVEEKLLADSFDAMYPFANMLRGSARYIADHRSQVCVFHVPGELLEQPKQFDQLMNDMALSWLLGLKIVIVVGCRFDVECCSVGRSPSECRNTLRVTDDKLLRKIEEDAGYVRFEVERMLNRCLRVHGGMSKVDEDVSPMPNGNVVGGNFYTAKPFGVVGETDYQNTGYPTKIYSEKIKQVLDRGDIVLLTTVGSSRLGSCINVNGDHLAASVASSLNAHKLVYLSSTGSVLRQKGSTKTLQEVPVSAAKAFLDHYQVQVHKAGFASFAHINESMKSEASVEMLLHMAWASWALDQGVKRAHIVNPGDGALLEELYTAKHGVNTCLYHDDEHEEFLDDLDGFIFPSGEEEILFSELPSLQP